LVVFAVVVSSIMLARFDGDGIRRDTLAALEAVSGRQWTLGDAVMFKPGVAPVLVLSDLRTPNVVWATRPDLLSVTRIEIESDWMSVLRRRPRIVALRLEGLELNLETGLEDNNNWGTPVPTITPANTATVSAQGLSELHSIELKNTRIRFRSGWGDIEKTYRIESIELRSSGVDSPLVVSVKAQVNEWPVSFSGELGSPAAMIGGGTFGVALEGRYSGHESDAEMQLIGQVGALSGLRDIHLKFSLKANSLNDVGSISGFALPRDTPISITAVVTSSDVGLNLEDYVLRIGQAIIRPSAAPQRR